MRALYLVLVVLLVTVAAPPNSAAGQWCGDCISDYQTTTHTNEESPSVFFGYYGPFHFASLHGLCIFYHEAGCSNALHSESGDHYALDLIKSIGEGVIYNADRKSLQILSCDGLSFVGNVPMTEADVALLFAAARPSVETR